MILVTVGTHHAGFDRLVRAADQLAENASERIVIQRGSSRYQPLFAESFDFTSYEQMRALMEEADSVVMHAAAGSVLMGLSMGKPLVLVPRLKKFQENYNDHQLELADALGKSDRAVVCELVSAEGLALAIRTATQQHKTAEGPAELIGNLRQYLSGLEDGGESG